MTLVDTIWLKYSLESMSSLSLFQRVDDSHLAFDPFPYLVIENALPENLHTELRRTFPSRQILKVVGGQNKRWSTPLLELRKIQGVTSLWRSFVEYHASQEFVNEVVTFFGDTIVQMYPKTFKSTDDIKKRPVRVRGVGSPLPGSLSLDSQVSGNTPVSIAGAPRGIHFDSTAALWAGLYYLRSEDDDSVGGDLELWRWPKSFNYKEKSSLYREGMSPDHAHRFRTIPYRSNTFVFIINSIDSLHSVTERMPTPHTRQFLNLLCDLSAPLFRPTPNLGVRIKNIALRHVAKLR